jgi:hypothetical protein
MTASNLPPIHLTRPSIRSTLDRRFFRHLLDPRRLGKITEHWAVTDMLSLMQQIGALASPDRGGR